MERWCLGWAWVVLVAFSLSSANAEVIDLGTLLIEGEPTTGPAISQLQRRLDAEALRGRTRSGASNLAQALEGLPGITVAGADAFGLAQTSLRVRGTADNFTNVTLDGLPVYGILPIGPRVNRFDLENLDTLTLIPQGNTLTGGAGNRGGSVEARLRRPSEASVQVSQQLGSNDYYKSFGRIELAPGGPRAPALFLSGSVADGDQWRGPGGSGPRRVASGGVLQRFGPNAQLFAFYNDFQQRRDTFRSLTFDQARDLDRFGDLGFNASLTGNPAEDEFYFKYHREELDGRDGFAQFRWQADPVLITLNPYVSWDDARLIEGARTRIRYLFRYGADVDVQVALPSNQRLDLHLWYERTDFEKYVQRFQITDTERVFRGYGFLADSEGEGQFYRPGVVYSGRRGPLAWELGLTYFNYYEPPSIAYQPGPDPSPDPGTAIAQSPGVDVDATVSGQRYEAVLPSAGLTYALSDTTTVHAHYLRQDQRPYAFVPLSSTFARNRQAFLDAGLTLDDVFSAYEVELADTLEIGVDTRGRGWQLDASAFYSRIDELLVTAEDPRVGVDYLQNVGEASTLGFEVLGEIDVTSTLWARAAATYTRARFDSNVNALDRAGNHVPDTPTWHATLEAFWEPGRLRVAPRLRHVGERFGDVDNDERISPYTVVDLRLSYRLLQDRLRLSTGVLNLFDRDYIAIINAGNDSVTGNYLPGAERTWFVTLDLELAP